MIASNAKVLVKEKHDLPSGKENIFQNAKEDDELLSDRENNFPNIISLTNEAIEKIKILLNDRDKPSVGIRIGVKTGGCSGKTYSIEYADVEGKFDEIVEIKGIKILIDPKALMYLIGAQMDYKEENFKSGFVFTNPNEKGGCGCGKSFST